MRTDKLERYRAERSKCLAKLEMLQARVKELDQKIVECENLEIRALMRTESMSLADLMALVRDMQQRRRASLPSYEEAYANDEEENDANDEN